MTSKNYRRTFRLDQTEFTLNSLAFQGFDSLPERPDGITLSAEFDDGLALIVSREDTIVATSQWDDRANIANIVNSSHVEAGTVAPLSDVEHEYVAQATEAADSYLYGLVVQAFSGAALNAIVSQVS